MTLEGTPDIVSPPASRGLSSSTRPRPSTASARAAPQQACEAIVVLLHEGGTPGAAGRHQRLQRLRADRRHRQPHDRGRRPVRHRPHAPAVQLRDRRAPGHERGSFGRLVTDIDLTLDRRTQGRRRRSRPTTRSSRADDVDHGAATSPALVDRYQALAAPLADRVIGQLTAPASRARPTTRGENAAGNLIADAQLAATRAATAPGRGVHEPGRRARRLRRAGDASPTARRSRCSRSATRWSR